MDLQKFGLSPMTRVAYTSYEEYTEWRRERRAGRGDSHTQDGVIEDGVIEDGVIEEAGGGGDTDGIVSTGTNVNVKAEQVRPVRPLTNWSEIRRFHSRHEFTNSDIAEELKQFTCKSKKQNLGKGSK